MFELKANEGASSLLHFALSSVHESACSSAESAAKTPLAPLGEEVPAVKSAAKLSSTELLEDVTKLAQGLALVAAEIDTYEQLKGAGPPNEGDAAACDAFVAGERFLVVMAPFYKGCKGQVEELRRATSETSDAQGKIEKTPYRDPPCLPRPHACPPLTRLCPLGAAWQVR